MKKLLSAVSVLTVLCLILAAVPFSASAAEQKTNATEVTIYAVDSVYQDALTIPDDCPQSFTFTVSGAESVSCYSYSNLTVTGTTVSPYEDTWYWYSDGYGYSRPQEGKTLVGITRKVSYGKKSATVVADGVSYNVTVNVVDYAEEYARKTARDYLDANIKSGMTTEQKLNVIAKFVADREYSTQYSAFVPMVVFGNGDCWASTFTVIERSKMIGLDAWVRNGNRDSMAGSGHKNAMVYDGK